MGVIDVDSDSVHPTSEPWHRFPALAVLAVSTGLHDPPRRGWWTVEADVELHHTQVWVVAGPDESLSDNHTFHARSNQGFYEGPMSYEVVPGHVSHHDPDRVDVDLLI